MELSIAIIAIFVTFFLLVCRKKIVGFIRFRRMLAKLPQLDETAYPLIGHSYLIAGDPVKFFNSSLALMTRFIVKYKEKLTVLWLGEFPLVVIFHPDSAEFFLKSSKFLEKTYVYGFFRPWLKDGLIISKGNKWKQRRRLLTPTFHFNILEDYSKVMNEQCRIMIAKIEKQNNSGVKIDLKNMLTLCALDIICKTAMGQTANAQVDQDSHYVRALRRMAKLIQLRQVSPWLWWDYAFKKTKIGKEHEETLNTLHSFTKSVMQERMQSKTENKKGPQRMAFLDVLMLAETEDGTKLSFDDIQEEVDTFMFAGHDTISSAMTWALFFIGCYPDIQLRIQNELDDVFGEDKERPTTIEDTQKLLYLEQVMKESLRIRPSVPFIGRLVTEDCKVNGYTIPKGAELSFFIYNLHHNPNVWEDPERFDPERFTKDNCSKRHPYAYIPFAAGPRNCIGQKFALLEEKVILSQILRKFTITSHDKPEDVVMAGDIVLQPAASLNIELIERK